MFVLLWMALHRQGLLKAIGVSNFNESHLKDLASKAEVMPMVNQGELYQSKFKWP